ncbi:type II toxin-antitoxin system VapC family toxin [Roseovarius aestuarii]|nr:type II toxin-antitoxin system VapC family toxin [Roseovarius aestuarii]
MFLDASVIVAILGNEPDAKAHLKHIEGLQQQLYCSPLARFEASVALARRIAGDKRRDTATHEEAERAVADFLDVVKARDIHISGSIGRLAQEAARTYGKTVGHPAQLNFGDCFAYACAKAYRVGVLYKGNDFAETDLA